MKNILEKIVEHKREEVEAAKRNTSVSELKDQSFFNRENFYLVKKLNEYLSNSIIAEFKRRSPSKGIINNNADVEKVVSAYVQFGASGVSILTDNYFFGGCSEDIAKCRSLSIPILRKDFI